MKNVLSLLLVVAMSLCTGACAVAAPVEAEMPAQKSAPVEVASTSEVAAPVEVSSVSEVAAPVEVSNPAVVTTYANQSPEAVDAAYAAVNDTAAAAPVETSSDEPACTLSGGGYVVDILNAKKGTDYLGNDCIIVHYKFTNNNSEPIAFAFIEVDKVSQSGKSLSMDGMVIDTSVDPDVMGLCQQVSNGQSVDVALVYPCYSNDPVDVSLTLVKDLNSCVPLASGSCTLALQ